MNGDPYYWNEKKSSPDKNVEFFGSGTNIEFIKDVSKNPPPPKNPPVSAPEKLQPRTSHFTDTDITELTKFTNPAIVAAKSAGKTSGLSIIILVIFILVCTQLWNETLHNFISQQLHGGKEISWVRYGIYASLFTILLLAIIHVTDVNFSVK